MLESWAGAIAAGVEDTLFWRSTPCEVRALIDALIDREQAVNNADNIRAGLITSAVYNVHRKKGAKSLKPKDFFREQKKPKGPRAMMDVMRKVMTRQQHQKDAE